MNYDKLIKDIITVEDKNNLVKLIEESENAIYKSKSKDKNNEASDPIRLKKELEDQKRHIESIDIIEIEVAKHLGSKSIKDIHSWFQTNLNKEIILNVKVEKDIIAGLTVSRNGKFLDLSKRKVFDA
jgi:F0F1-type ATP synthase delta subunit